MSYGVGFYGCGYIGKVHIYAYKNLSMYYDPPALKPELRGVCTSSKKSAEKAKNEFGFEYGTTDFEKLLNDDKIDIVHCVTPNYLHHDFLVEAIKAGKHIYCEKPLVLNGKEAENIKKTVQKEDYQKKFQMTHQYRYLPATLKAKKMIENNFLGEIFGFRGQYLHSSYIDKQRPMSWRLEKEKAGSGALGDLGSHILDLIYHLLGPFSKIAAAQKTFVKERPISTNNNEKKEVKVDDVTNALVYLKNGGMGTVESWRVATGTEDELKFEIHGRRGALRFNLMEPNWLEVFDNTESSEPLGGQQGWKKISTIQKYPAPASFPGSKCPIGWMRAHVECLHSFLTSISRDQATSPDLKEGIYITRVLDKIAESAQKEEWVSDLSFIYDIIN